MQMEGIKMVGAAIYGFILKTISLTTLPCTWTPRLHTHLDFIIGRPRAGYCVVRKVTSQQERASELFKL